MTRHTPEGALKYPLAMEEPKKLEENLLSVRKAQTSSEPKSQLEITQITTEIELKRKGLRKMVPELYNLEDYAESEKPVKIDLDLDLYQMEEV